MRLIIKTQYKIIKRKVIYTDFQYFFITSIDFTVEPVEELPKKQPRKERSSKYQPILDEFLNSEHSLVRVDTDVEANYLAMVLKKIIEKKGIDSVKVSVRNGKVFLEK